jgi:hypothetical protein
MSASIRHSQGPDLMLAAYTGDDLLALADSPVDLTKVHLQLHLRGATLDFPDGLDEIQLRRLTDYASVLDWHGQRIQ